MANYNDVIEKNKRYLTQAQIDALVAASKQYNVENAGNRAGALSSARQQFDAGYRGLQNMGLAGATAAQPTSGEVPRLIQQIRTPVDDYNRRLQDVENKRLNALGGQFAQQTQAAWAAQAQREAEARERARQETLRQQQQRAEQLVRINNRNTLPSSPKITVADLTTPSVKEFDEPKTPTAAERAAQKYQQDGLKRTAAVAQQAAINAAAALLGITVPNNMQQAEQARLDREAATARNVQNTVTQATKPVLNQKTGDQYTYDTYTEAKEMQRAADDFAAKATRAARANKTNNTTEQDERALKEAQANVDYIDSLYKKMAKGEDLTDAEIKAMSQDRVAVQQRDLEKEKLENPEKYAARLVLSDPSKRGTTAWTKATHLMAPEIADNVLESMGIRKPNMTDEQFTADMQMVKDVRRSLDVIDSLRQEQENKRKTGTTGAIDYDQQFIDEELETLKKLGYTEAQARKLVKRVSNERQTRSEYEYYQKALETEIKNDGLKPLKPVNKSETDTTYRLANNLPSMSLVAKTDYEALATAPAGPAEYMNDKQRNTYNALYETEGIEAANKYVEDISPLLNLQRAEKDKAYRQEMVNKGTGSAIWQNLLSVGTNLVGNVPAMLEKLAISGYNIVANPDVPVYIDQNSGLSQLSNRTNYIREATSEKILTAHPNTWGKVANFLYQSGMSMADSAAAMAVAGALGNTHAVDVLFFSSAGNEAYRDARERGATQEQAMGFSILSGAAEAIFEHVSVETFADQFIRQNAKARRSTIAKLLIQSGTEASEEVTTEIANKLADAWVMGDKSEYDLKVKELMSKDKTLTKEQAEKKAFMDALKDVGMAGLGGLVSGLGFGLIGAIATKKSETKTGKAVKENGKLDRLTRAAKLFGGDVAQQAAEVEAGKQSDAQVGNLLHELQLAQNEALGIDAESNEQITEAQAEEIAKKGEALDVIMEGEQITADDAQKVIDTLGADKLAKMGYDASSAEAFAKSYNDNLQKQNIAPMSEVAKAENEFRQNKAVEQIREASFERVYKNPKQGLAYQYEGQTVTPMPGNLTAVSFAEQERNNFKARTTATSGNVTYAFSGMQAREGMSNEQTLAEMQKALTKEARNKAEVYSKLASALGIKMTIHDVMTGTNGFIDESGNMHVVLSGKQSVLRVAAHELTHWMKGNNSTGYASLRQHLVNEVGADRFDRMLKQKAREYGIDTSTEKGRTVADDEVCAELCERMLSNEEALEKFAEKDTEAAKSLKDRLLKILNAIKQALKNVKNRNFGESWSDLIREQETIESWVEGLQEAIKNADARAATNEGQIGKVAGVTTVDHNDLIADIKDAKTDAEIDDAINEHSVDIIEYDMAGYRQDLVNAGIMTKDELDSLFDTMKKAVDKVKMHRSILDFGFQLSEKAQNDPELAEKEIAEAKAGRSYLPYKQNADPHYKLALDFSTLCRKRVLLQTIQERLQARMGRATTQEETVAIRLALQKLQREGYKVEVACALCYVEAARLKSPKVINAFLNNTANEMRNYFAKKNPESKAIIEGLQQQWKVDHGLAPDATKNDMKAAGVNVTEYNNYSRDLREQFEGNDSEESIVTRALDLVKNHRNVFLSASELTKLKKSDPDIFSAFTDKVRSATRSKAQETDTFYSRGDINMVTEAILNYANAESGFRHQSWSDFVPTHLLDTMAAVIEMSTRKAKMHAYTKVPAMVRLLGKTGMALNMSLIPSGNTGIDASGNLSFDSVEGMPWEVMMELRDMFPDTAGNIAIGINGEQIQKLLASKDIDYVIPYHASGMNKNMRGYLDIRAWSEYTSSQNEKTNHRGTKGKAPELAEWFDEKAAAKATDGEAFMREASEKYLQLCYERNLTPKFAQYLQNNGDGSYSLKEGYENYWKMLTDRKMVNQKTGKVIIQQAVKPTFDQDTVLGILEDRLNDPAIQDAERAADIVTEQFSNWRADRNNADAEAIQAAKDLRDRTAAITAQKTAEAGGVNYSLDTDAIRQAFTVIDADSIEDGLEALKGVKHVGMFALKDISRMLDASAGKNKDLRNTLHAIFEKPHSEATGRYARGVERMQNRVLDIAVRAGVVSEKDLNNFRRKIGSIRLDSEKSAAIQNIGEGFSNTYTDLKLKVKDADHVTVKAYEQGTDKLVVSEKDYTLKELRKAYGTNAADYVWSQVFDKTQKAQETGKQAEWVEETVNTRPYTLADLQAAFPNDWQQLKHAADEFREMYDEYIRDQNNMLATIYPIESEFDTEEKLEGAIEKKHERLAQHKAEVNARITSINEKTEQRIKAHKEATDQRVASIEKRIEKLETEMAEKKRTDTKAYRDLQNRAFNLFADKENAIAEAAEYEAGQRAKAQALIDALKADLKEYEENAKSDLDRLGAAKAEAQNARQRGELDSLSRMHRLQYRSDYFHHFTEMASGVQNLRAIFTNNTDISPKIVGRSENTKAKARWAGYFQERMGGDYTADAINGMLEYGQLAEYKLAFDPLTAYLRDVNNAIRKLDDNTNRDGLIRYIDQWADAIAGKSHKLDRNISDLGMAPRKAMQILNWINSRVIQNTLLFNARSSLLQISNITNAMGIVKNINDWMNGLRSWALAAKGDQAMADIMAQSNFLASRYMDNLQLTDSKLKSVKAFGGWLLGALDEISAKATWWAAYHQYIRNPKAAKNQYRAYDNAIDYADDVTRRTHAGRGVGELAPAMTSRVINFVAPFQVEVNNTFQLMKDNVKQGNYLGILSTGLSVFLFNALFEGIVGSSPLQFDFIRAVLDIVLGFAQDDPNDDKDDYGILQAWQRLSGEAFGSLPYAGQLASVIGKDTAKKLFGEDNDATRYGNTQIGINAVINAGKGVKDIATGLVEGRKVNWVDDLDDLLNLTLPFGAKQLTRTIEGVRTVAKGYEGKYDKEGKEEVHFTTDGDILEAIHAALFGKWSLTEASEYFGEKRLLPQLFGEYNGPKSSIGNAVDAQEYKAALQTGIDGKEYFTLKADMSKYTTQPGKRAEMMQQKLTPEQKAKLDALMVPSKDAEMKVDGAVVYQKSGDEWKVKADYTNQDLFDLSQAGDKAYTGTLEAMKKTGLPQDQAALAASMWDRAKEADDRKAEFRSMLRDNANLTVEQKEALDLQYCGNKYPADYSDPELYDLSVTNRATYEKAKEAKAKGVPVSTFTGLSEKKAAHEGDGQAAYMRGEIMKTNLTAKQKELLDDLLVSDKGANPDYSSQAWFDLSMISKTQYDKAKAGAKVGVKPEVYLAAYKKYKEVNRKEGDKYVNTKKEAKALLKAYMDKQPISAPVYDYIWTAVFGYKSR